MFNKTVINLAFPVELGHVLTVFKEKKHLPQQKRKYSVPQTELPVLQLCLLNEPWQRTPESLIIITAFVLLLLKEL